MNHFYSMNVCAPAKCTALCLYMQLWEDYAEIMYLFNGSTTLERITYDEEI